MNNLFLSLPVENIFLFRDSNKPLQNLIFVLGTKNQDWFDIKVKFLMEFLSGKNERSMN